MSRSRVGQILGETPFLDGRPRPTTAVAVEKGTLLRFRSDGLRRWLVNDHESGRRARPLVLVLPGSQDPTGKPVHGGDRPACRDRGAPGARGRAAGRADARREDGPLPGNGPFGGRVAAARSDPQRSALSARCLPLPRRGNRGVALRRLRRRGPHLAADERSGRGAARDPRARGGFRRDGAGGRPGAQCRRSRPHRRAAPSWF